jgi:CRP-like cAMP-binding protein
VSPAAASAWADEIPWLARLREDERERAATRFTRLALAAGERHTVAPDARTCLGIVLAGEVVVSRAELPGLAPTAVTLGPGDRFGELAVFAGQGGGLELAASAAAEIALLDADAFAALVDEFPVVWVAVVTRLSRELKWKDDLLREIRDFEANRVDAATLEVFLAARRRRVTRRRAGVARAATRLVAQRLFAEPARQPLFWVLAGFVGAILVSRLVVASILRFDLQETLFNLRDSGGANPIHTHHFNYGFALLIAAGLLGFFPRARQRLRTLACAFGIGLGLVFDEFALIWNLNPDYYQRLSYEAQAVLVAILVQLVYFRRFYAALLERLLRRVGVAS